MINTYRLGPGTLELGAGAFAVSGQIRACRVVPAETVTTREAIPVLSGEELPKVEVAENTFTISGTMLQDLLANGVIDWSWTNATTEQPFVFVPNDVLARGVQGILVPVPLEIGGDVQRQAAGLANAGDPPEVDFTWRIIGTPDFGAVA